MPQQSGRLQYLILVWLGFYPLWEVSRLNKGLRLQDDLRRWLLRGWVIQLWTVHLRLTGR